MADFENSNNVQEVTAESNNESKEDVVSKIPENKQKAGSKSTCLKMILVALLSFAAGVCGTAFYTQQSWSPRPGDLYLLDEAIVEKNIIENSSKNGDEKIAELKKQLVKLRGIEKFSSDESKNKIYGFVKELEKNIIREDEKLVLAGYRKRLFWLVNNQGNDLGEKRNGFIEIQNEINAMASTSTDITKLEIASLSKEIGFNMKLEGYKLLLSLMVETFNRYTQKEFNFIKNKEKIERFKKMQEQLEEFEIEDEFDAGNFKNVLEEFNVKLRDELEKCEKLQKQIEENKPKLEARFKELIKNFNIDKDKLEDKEFYSHKNNPKYSSERTGIGLYIGKTKNVVFLRGKFQYTSTDWLWFESFTCYVDGDKYEKKDFGYNDFERDNGYGKIWEYVDIIVENDFKSIMKKISDSKEATVRYNGRKYYHDYKVSNKDKTAIKETLELYDLLTELKELED